MKNLINNLSLILILFSIITLTSSCEKVDDLSDSALIEQIKNSELIEINFNTLPQSTQTKIQNNYIPSGDIPHKSFESPSLGYMVNLIGNGRTTDIFFNNEGAELNRVNGDDSSESCWDYSYPITYIMSDGTEILIENEGDFILIREWEESNPNLDLEITLVFPITIEYGVDQTISLESFDEIREWEEQNCN